MTESHHHEAIMAPYQDMLIADLEKAIRSENSKARSLARKSLDHVRCCGEMLIALKVKAGHGSWKFMPKSLGMSQKTASNYMRIASNWQRVAVMDHGVKDALALLCREDTPPSTPTPRLSLTPVTIEAHVMDPLTQKESGRLAESECIIEIEPLVVDGTKTESPPKNEEEVITFRVSELEEIISLLDEGLKLLADSKGKSKIILATSLFDWKIPSRHREPNRKGQAL